MAQNTDFWVVVERQNSYLEVDLQEGLEMTLFLDIFKIYYNDLKNNKIEGKKFEPIII